MSERAWCLREECRIERLHPEHEEDFEPDAESFGEPAPQVRAARPQRARGRHELWQVVCVGTWGSSVVAQAISEQLALYWRDREYQRLEIAGQLPALLIVELTETGEATRWRSKNPSLARSLGQKRRFARERSTKPSEKS